MTDCIVAGRLERDQVFNIKEVVVNAVYHRGYDVREPVEVRIKHDELVVLSYPGPDRSERLEQLRAGRAWLAAQKKKGRK